MWRHVQYSPSGRMQPTGALRQSWLLEAHWQTQGSSFAAVDCRHARLLGVAQRRPQQPSLPGSAESAADIKLSCWRGALGQQGLNTPVLAQWSTHPPARWKTGARTPAIANTASCPRQHAEEYCNFQQTISYPRQYSGQYFRPSRGRPGLNSRPRRLQPRRATGTATTQ